MEMCPAPARRPQARRCAIVGGGPAGLSCAYYLALMGHKVTIFEQRENLGGMLRYGIPNYRCPRAPAVGDRLHPLFGH